MNMLISTAAGLLAAEVLGKRRSRRRYSNSSSSSSTVSRIISPDYKGHRRIQAAPPPLSTPKTQSSSTTLEPSLSSLSSSSDSDSNSSSDFSSESDSDSDSDSDTETSTTPVPRRLTHQNLQTHTDQQQALIPHPSSTSSSSYSSTNSSTSAPSTLHKNSLLPPPLPPRTRNHHHHPPLPPRPHTIPPPPTPFYKTKSAHPLHTRLQTFLPAIRAANASLLTSPNPSNHNIESLTSNNNEQAYIEMDLGLGVLEERQQQRREKDGFEALKSPGMLKRERERSRESVRRVVGVMDKEEEEEGEDLLGRLMGRAAGGVGEAREAKRRRVVGIEVL